MNTRQAELLFRLLADKEIEMSEWMEHYRISERTLRNDIQTLEGLLSRESRIFLRDGKIRAEFPEESRKAISEMISSSDFYRYRLSNEERILVSCLMLLCSSTYRTAGDLAEILSVSRNTVVNEIPQMKEWLGTHGLTLESRNKFGLRVEGEETAIRRAISDIASDGGEKSRMFSMLVRQMLYQKEVGRIVERAVLTYEKAYQMELSDASFQKIVLDILILFKRVQESHYVTYEERWKEGWIWAAAEGILETVRRQAGMAELPEDEVFYLAQSLKMRIPIQKGLLEKREQDDLEMMAVSFACSVCMDCEMETQISNETLAYLVRHIAEMMGRSKEGEQIAENLYQAKLEQVYPRIFQAVKNHRYLLEKVIAKPLSRDETAYLVMNFAVAMEELTMLPVKTLLVCSTGKYTALLIKVKLKRHFNLNIIESVPAHSVRESRIHEAELVLSTVPLEIAEKPVVRISPLLEEKDILQIHEQIEKVYRRRFEEGVKREARGSELAAPSLTELMSATRIRLDADAATWEEAIREAGDLLVQDGMAEPRYIDKMIQNISRFGPYIVFVPGVAVAHAGWNDGSWNLAVSLVRLRTPVAFGHEKNDPVQWVFCVGTAEGNEHVAALFQLMKIITDNQIRQQMEDIQKPEELLELFRKNE